MCAFHRTSSAVKSGAAEEQVNSVLLPSQWMYITATFQEIKERKVRLCGFLRSSKPSVPFVTFPRRLELIIVA